MTEDLPKIDKVETKPTMTGFMSKYLRALFPIILLLIFDLIFAQYMTINKYLFSSLLVLTIVTGLVISWVRWWSEAFTSYIMSFILLIVLWKLGYFDIRTMLTFSQVSLKDWEKIFLLGSLIELVYVEVFRESISYVISDRGVEISGGVFTKRQRTMLADKIHEVIVKKHPFFNVGTVIVSTTTGMSLQEDTHSAGVGKESHGWIGGVMYSRSRKKESDDPLNVLFGISNPTEIAEKIKILASLDREINIKQYEVLKNIENKLDKGDNQ